MSPRTARHVIGSLLMALGTIQIVFGFLLVTGVITR